MQWLSSLFRPTQHVTTVADVPAATTPKTEMPQTLRTFTRPPDQQENFSKVVDGFSHAREAMRLPRDKNHFLGAFELLRVGKTGVRLSAFRALTTLDGSNFDFFKQCEHVEPALAQLTEWTMKEMGVQDFIEDYVDDLFANGRRPHIGISYNEARDPAEKTYLHKDAEGESMYSCLHYANVQATDGVEFTFNDDSVKVVLDRNPRQLPPAIIAMLRSAHETSPPADGIYETKIEPNGGVIFNNVLFSHSSPGPWSRGLESRWLLGRVRGLFEWLEPNGQQAYDTCMQLRATRLERRLLPEERAFLRTSPGYKVIDVVEGAILGRVQKLYMEDFVNAGLSVEMAGRLFKDVGTEPLNAVFLGDEEVPVGDPMQTLPRRRSLTLAPRGEQPLQEVPKRPSFVAIQFVL